MVLLNVNNNFSSTRDILINSKYNIMAISLASSMLDEIMQEAFDENVIEEYVASTSLMSNIGPDNEAYGSYDDIDDFDNYWYETEPVDKTKPRYVPGPVYRVWVDVNYINPAQPNLAQNTKTFYKKVTVNVTMPYLAGEVLPADTVKLEKVFTYFIFR
ncbi:MAG: hypothetical protein ACEPO8_00345 [Rhodothermaceae bacterium]